LHWFLLLFREALNSQLVDAFGFNRSASAFSIAIQLRITWDSASRCQALQLAFQCFISGMVIAGALGAPVSARLSRDFGFLELYRSSEFLNTSALLPTKIDKRGEIALQCPVVH
jgi:hypothetical protein